MNIESVRKSLEKELSRKRISAWERGVIEYAFELLESVEFNQNTDEQNIPCSKEVFLNGASNWTEYSYGGCSLIYDYDIAKRLCTPSEFRKTKEGELNPNKNETWLEVQARALFQAYNKIKKYALN